MSGDEQFDESLAASVRLADITRVGKITGMDTGLRPIWFAVRPASASLAISQGIGTCDRLARISAVMESLEAFHAETHNLETHEASLAEIGAGARDYVDVSRLPFATTPPSAETKMNWVRATRLASGSACFVPEDYVDMRFFTPRSRPAIFPRNSNGLAGGRTVEDALFHGLCEVVENHQLCALHAPEGKLITMVRKVDLDSVQDSDTRELIRQLTELRVSIHAWHVKWDMNTPTFKCLLMSEEWPYPLRSSGYGAHPRREIALKRAVYEALQARATFVAGARDDKYHDIYEKVLLTRRGARGDEHGLGHCSTISLEDVWESSSSDLGAVVDDLERHGMHQVVWVDLTRSDIRIPFVKVVVPDLDNADDLGEVPGFRFLKMLERGGW